jgi:hypothetical protein
MKVERCMSKRTKITPNTGDSRYVRRDAQGRFTSDQTDVGRSISADKRKQAEHHAPKGQKDRGD